MKSVLSIAVVLVLLTAAVSSSTTGRESRNAIFAFVNVNVFPMEQVDTVTVGKRADLLLLDLDSNPLANTGATEQLAGVMINARWMPKEKK